MQIEWIEQKPISPAGYQCRVFQAKLEDGHLTVFVGREPAGKNDEMKWHLSMSHRSNHLLSVLGKPNPGRLPMWEEIKEARYRFCPDDVYMAQILPPKSEYINLHPTTIHLHEVDGDNHGP